MKICAISDTHGMHRMIRVMPEADVLVHAGDITSRGGIEELTDCVLWMQEQKQYKHRVLIAGNHDFSLDRRNGVIAFPNFKEFCAEHDVHYLEGSGVTLDGVKFWGGPWTPRLPGWAFQEKEDTWSAIPNDTNVLVTHGPPYFIGDLVGQDHEVQIGLGTHVGSKALDKAISFLLVRSPETFKAHICGHIHESYGFRTRYNRTFVVACTCTRQYVPSNPPILFDLETGERVTP